MTSEHTTYSFDEVDLSTSSETYNTLPPENAPVDLMDASQLAQERNSRRKEIEQQQAIEAPVKRPRGRPRKKKPVEEMPSNDVAIVEEKLPVAPVVVEEQIPVATQDIPQEIKDSPTEASFSSGRNQVKHNRRELGKGNYRVRNEKNTKPANNRVPNNNSKNSNVNTSRGGVANTHNGSRFTFAGIKDWDKIRSFEEAEAFFAEKFTDKACFNWSEILSLSIEKLQENYSLEGLTLNLKFQKRFILKHLLREAYQRGDAIQASGVLELLPDGNGVLVSAAQQYETSEWSPFVPRSLVRRWGLKRGHNVEILGTLVDENSSTPCALKIVSVMGKAPENALQLPNFKDLTPYYPTERIFLEDATASAGQNLSMRIVDLLAPIGLGQRGLVVAPPRTGKTMLLQAMANAIAHNRPEVHLMVLLIDERPEEVTDFKRMTNGDVFASTFDETADRHVHLAEMVIENARRRVENGEHVVILLDSITRLARAYNTLMPTTGRVLTGGVEATALQGPKSFFGSARNIEGGGSLTIIGTALVETGSRMDDVIFEEFKGTGNMELHLDRELAEKRIFPALNVGKSGTRKEELLYHPDELSRIYIFRRALMGIQPTEAMEMLIQRIKKTANNVEFLMSINR